MTLEPITDPATLAREAESLLLAICPELAARPFYIIPASQLGPGWGEVTWFGLAGPNLDLAFRAEIGDRWQGRGPCLLVNDLRLPELAAPSRIRPWFLAFAIHEAAHVLTEPWDFADYGWNPSPAFRANVREFLVTTPTLQENEESLIEHHRPDWIRASIHLHQRAAKFVPGIPFRAVMWNSLLAFRPHIWRDELGDEPSRMAHLSIAEILKSDSPASFQRCWQDALRTSRGEFFSWWDSTERTETMSTPVDFFATLDTAAQKRRDNAVAELQALARGIADGKDPDAEGTLDLLREADWTPEKLRAEVARLIRRKTARERIAAAVGVDDDERQVREELAKKEAAFVAAQDRHVAGLAPLEARLNEIHKHRSEAEQAHRDLQQTACSDRQRQLNAVRHEKNRVADLLAKARDTSAGDAIIASGLESAEALINLSEKFRLPAQAALERQQGRTEKAHFEKMRIEGAAEREKRIGELMPKLAQLEKQVAGAEQALLED